ncbi:MAG: YqiA/YcfP family alpha/beta fold hydrolase [Xanthomonadales bacterium]|nr:YqiA/YcfP family alpha/beta fold hydrolase [Xanthomonadales bacterium]
MNSFYYFNGFNAAIPEDYSGSPKVVAAANYARHNGFRFRPVSVNYRAIDEHVERILDDALQAGEQVVFCGSSLGGWLARIMQLLLAAARPGRDVRAIGWNPAFDLHAHGHMLLGPQVNQVTCEAYEWTPAQTARLQALESRVDYDAALPFYVYVDRADEVIDWQASAERHRPIARFLAFEGGSHSFEHFDAALADFGQQIERSGGDSSGGRGRRA